MELRSHNKRKAIPKAVRKSVWEKYNNDKGTAPCLVCKSIISTFTFEVGHNFPFSRGGGDDLDNLKPICSSCNKGMGDRYTIDEYIAKYYPSNITNNSHLKEGEKECDHDMIVIKNNDPHIGVISVKERYNIGLTDDHTSSPFKEPTHVGVTFHHESV